MTKNTIQVFDYLFVMRPTLFFPVWTVFLAGAWAQERFSHAAFANDTGTWLSSWIWILFLYTLVMGSVYIINQVMDLESDRVNDKLYLITSGAIGTRTALWQTAILAGIGIAGLLPERADLIPMFVITGTVLGWMYSCPPPQFENRPVAGAGINFAGGYIIFITGWMSIGPFEWEALFHATPYALGILAVYFFTTIPDIPGDRQAGKRTVAVQYGLTPTLWAGFLSNCAAAALSIWLQDWVILIPSLLITPFYVYTLYTREVRDTLKTNKFAALFLSLAVCIRFPGYLILIIGIYMLSKWYYRRRFQMTYPSFKT
jgi:4-hydroxybenzoate polyprenyltransferase